MPIVRVEIAKGVASAEQKRTVIRRMTDVLAQELGRNPEYIFVIIDEVDPDNWGRKGVPLTDLWQPSEARCLKEAGCGLEAIFRPDLRAKCTSSANRLCIVHRL